MTTKYLYSLLKYKDVAKDEKLNIGLLIYFPKSGNFVFKDLKQLDRVINAFNLKATANFIQCGYINTFTELAKGLNIPLDTNISDCEKQLAKTIKDLFLFNSNGCIEFGKIFWWVVENEEKEIVKELVKQFTTY